MSTYNKDIIIIIIIEYSVVIVYVNIAAIACLLMFITLVQHDPIS